MKVKIIIIFLLISNILLSQNKSSEIISWKVPYSEGKMSFLSFENANYNEDYLPVFVKKIKVKDLGYSVKLTNMRFVPLSKVEIEAIKNKEIAKSIKIESKVFKNRKDNFLTVEFVPLRLNSKTNLIEKLISFQIIYTPINKTKSISTILSNVNSSGMSNGEWAKIGIVKTGVYKISYDQMEKLGISNPSEPRIYGYGGKVMPEFNGDPMFDDMNELSVEVEKGADGVFGKGDYILFYTQGPQTWYYDKTYQQFRHYQNNYSDTIFYFLSSNIGTTKIVQMVNQSSESALDINVYLDKVVHEKDEVNLLRSGKLWLGEEYNIVNNSYDFTFNISNFVKDSLVRLHTFGAARCGIHSYIKVKYGNSEIQSVWVPKVDLSSSTGYYIRKGSSFNTFYANSGNILLSTSYDQYSTSNAWLNYICVNAVRKLSVTTGQINFTNIYNINGVNSYQVSNTSSLDQVWNVSDFSNPYRINSDYSNSVISFKEDASEMNTYAIFQPSTAYSVASIYKVKNQNLHALENIEFVILTNKIFKSQAEQIAEYHRNTSGLKTIVVTNEEVYNEFSSGTPDVTAIKNFMRHLYKNRSFTDTLKYLMLMGDGSYDNKTQSSSNSNYVLTYQSDGSIQVNGTFVCDDYYGLLDDNEGVLSGYLDIGIGRIVVKNQQEANNAVEKIINYNTNNESYGNWRSLINFVADNGDGNLHVSQADEISRLVQSSYPEFDINKIYIDAYPLEESSGGDVVPEATHEFNNAINYGTLILNYTGHGGELGLAHEQLITIHDIQSWTNKNKLATFVTATCEFTRYDDKNRTSAGEYTFLNPNGGAIALFTTTRIAYAGPNKIINTAFYNNLFNDDKFRMGDIIRQTKNDLGQTSTNMRNFTLIGDPALSMAIPKEKVLLDSIKISLNPIKVISINDTLNPLSKVTITGKVKNQNGQFLTDFNGIIYPTVFDKADTLFTLCQHECSSKFPFESRKSIIYRGKASVRNGKFSFTFVVPKDISYKNGLGRISYYADNKSDDAWGYFNIGISGNADTSIVDNKGPIIDLYMNDENFIYGGTTDEEPVFIAKLSDENGINTVGNGIGHDLTAKLDNDNNQLSILNTYYESDIDSYQSGKVTYPYEKLSDGKHTLHFKAWDVFNNSSEQDIEFYVAESHELAIKNIFNYPNPFTTNTDFYFDHNQANQNLDVLIQIFTVSGKLVKTIEANIFTEGFRSSPINWNGRDDYNDPIGRGVYIYKLKVKTEDGQSVTEFQKLVILK